jgi:hypothetical protein
MAKLISDAGEMQVNIRSMECEPEALVLVGQIGVWKSRIVFPAEELWAMVPVAPKLGMIRLLLRGAWRAMTHRQSSPPGGTAGN